jgi:UDP-N-acetylmuramoylalanine--D-glutamate ligase
MTELLTELRDRPEVLILGFGKEGQSTYKYILQNFPGVTIGIADMNPEVENIYKNDLPKGEVKFHLGNTYLEALGLYPLIIKSPGVSIPGGISSEIQKRITTQTRLFLRAYNRQVIGVTGTKGKSTTSSLIHHLIKESGRNTVLVGNIGLPPFDYIEEITDDTLIVFELSSHQLEDTTHAPFISVLLNLYPEHLDRYDSLRAYYDAKMKIITGQEKGDVFIYNEDVPEIGHRISEMRLPRKYLSFSSGIHVTHGAFLAGDQICLAEEGRSMPLTGISPEFYLRGKHNRMNMMAAILAARAAGIHDSSVVKGLATFKGLEHRLEYVGNFREIDFFNDSIATIPEAAMAAVRSLPETDTMILGGFDRNLEYFALIDFLAESSVRNFIFLGKAGLRMHDLFKLKEDHKKNFFVVKNLEEAFKIIPQVTESGKICLLSPAAASYDIFRNFEERGSIFKKLARSL